jgi:hypothetical protein
MISLEISHLMIELKCVQLYTVKSIHLLKNLHHCRHRSLSILYDEISFCLACGEKWVWNGNTECFSQTCHGLN